MVWRMAVTTINFKYEMQMSCLGSFKCILQPEADMALVTLRVAESFSISLDI